MDKKLAALAGSLLAASAANAETAIRIGVATSGGTTLPALVISQQKLDEKQGLKIDWVRQDQSNVAKGLTLHEFDVSFAEPALDLIRQRARGDKVSAVYGGIMANVYGVTKSTAPYRDFGDLKGKKIGVYSLTSSSTAALVKVVRQRWQLELRKDFEAVVAPPPVLAGLLQKGDIEAMINVDPLVLSVLDAGGSKQIMDLDGEWQALTGSRLLVTTIAAWDDYARKNPEDLRRLIRAYCDAVDYIVKNPQVYIDTGFIKMSGLPETPAMVKQFEERFSKLYTAKWDQQLVDANTSVFEVAIEMGNLEAIPPDWYSFAYAN